MQPAFKALSESSHGTHSNHSAKRKAGKGERTGTLAELKPLPIWLNHADKKPFYADGEPRGGAALDSPADRARLVDYDTAVVAAKRSGRYLGIALGPIGDGRYVQGIDLDHVDEHPEVAALVDSLPGYVERSPSGKGYHAVGIGKAFPTLGANGTGVEAYCGKRFFTFTGDVVRDAP